MPARTGIFSFMRQFVLSKSVITQKYLIICAALACLFIWVLLIGYLASRNKLDRIIPCIGVRTRLGIPFAFILPPPDHFVIRKNSLGEEMLLATTPEGDLICRYTQGGNTLANVDLVWSPDRQHFIWQYEDEIHGSGYGISGISRPVSPYWISRLYLTDPQAGTMIFVSDKVIPHFSFAPAWSPDGESIVFVSTDQSAIPHFRLHILSIDNLQTISSKNYISGEGIEGPLWSPDDKHFVIAVNHALIAFNQIEARIMIIDNLLQEEKEIISYPDTGKIEALVWQASGELTYEVKTYSNGFIDTQRECSIQPDGTQNICTYVEP